MADFVGVTAFSIPDPAETKQQALLFDRIAVPGLSTTLTGEWGLPEQERAELSWLRDHEVLSEALLTATRDELHVLRRIERRFVEQPNYFTRCVADQMRTALRIDAVALESGTPLRYRRFYAEPRTAADDIPDIDYLVRAACLPDRTSLMLPDRTIQPSRRDVDGPTVSEGAVVEILLNKFPAVLDDTPWETILEVRRDRDLAQSRMALRRWIRTVAKGSFAPTEVEQEIDYLLGAYTEHLRRHDVSIAHSTLSTVVVGCATVLEDLVKVRWGKLAESLFAVSMRRSVLLKEELNAPGREVSYLLKVQHKLDQT